MRMILSLIKIMELNNLGSIKNQETGETLIRMFGPPNALTSDVHDVSRVVYVLSETLIRGASEDNSSGGGLGGEFGYGTKFENEVFFMHPYCWCESKDCLWCGGLCECDKGVIEYFLDGKLIKSWSDANEQIVAPLPWEVGEYGTPEYKEAKKIFNASIKERNRRLKTVYPAIAHTCKPEGFFDDVKKRKKWGFQSAPNFWHKPSGFKMCWYKWIGRDMTWNFVPDNAGEIFAECFDSLSKEMLIKAQAAHDYENTPEYLEQERRQQSRFMEHLMKREPTERGFRIPYSA